MGQFLGFLFFLTVACCGFWGIIFLSSMVPLWLDGYFRNTFKEKKGIVTATEPRQILPNQKGINVIFKK